MKKCDTPLAGRIKPPPRGGVQPATIHVRSRRIIGARFAIVRHRLWDTTSDCYRTVASCGAGLRFAACKKAQRALPMCSASPLPALYAGNLTRLLLCRTRREYWPVPTLAIAASTVNADSSDTDRGVRTRAVESPRSISGDSCRRTRRTAASRTHRQCSSMP